MAILMKFDWIIVGLYAVTLAFAVAMAVITVVGETMEHFTP